MISQARREILIRGWGILLGVPALFVLGFYYLKIPVLGTMETCAVKHFLHFPCPGCGLTNSFISLTHGNIRQSIDAHPLGIVIALWLAYMAARVVAALIAGKWPKELLTQRQRDIIIYVFCAAMMVNWMLRLFVSS